MVRGLVLEHTVLDECVGSRRVRFDDHVERQCRVTRARDQLTEFKDRVACRSLLVENEARAGEQVGRAVHVAVHLLELRLIRTLWTLEEALVNELL